MNYAGPWFLKTVNASFFNVYPLVNHCYHSNWWRTNKFSRCNPGPELRATIYLGDQCIQYNKSIGLKFAYFLFFVYSCCFYFYVKSFKSAEYEDK